MQAPLKEGEEALPGDKSNQANGLGKEREDCFQWYYEGRNGGCNGGWLHVLDTWRLEMYGTGTSYLVASN